MPSFIVYQRVSHPGTKRVLEKESHISGYDLKHAIEMVRVPAPMKRDLEKKYWSETTDITGRRLYVEIKRELKE